MNSKPLQANPLERLAARLRRVGLRNGLRDLGAIYRSLRERPNDTETRRRYSEHTLAFLAGQLAARGNESRSGVLTEVFGAVVNDYQRAGDLRTGTPKGGALAILGRLAYQQFFFQEPWGATLPRALILFQDIPARPEMRARLGIDFADLAHKALGMSVQQFVTCGFAVLALAQERPVFSRRFLANFQVPPVLFDRFLSVVSATPQQLRARLPVLDEGFEVYGLNPLQESPLVKLTRDEYALPIPEFLLERVTNYLYYAFAGVDKDFGTRFGGVFEAYVCEVINAAFPGLEQSAEVQLRSGDKTVDGLVKERDSLILFDAKAARIPIAVRSEDGIEGAVALWNRTIVRGIRQCFATEAAIAGRAPELERFSGTTRTWRVIVSLWPIYLANSTLARPKVLEAAQAPEATSYACMSIRELEHFLWIAGRRGGLGTALDEVEQGLVSGSADVSVYIGQHVTSDFSIPMLDERHRRFVAEGFPEEARGLAEERGL